MIHINKLHATIKLNAVYTCALCGKREIGDIVRFEFIGESGDELKDYINSTYQSSNAMPVGWSFHGIFSCQCKDYKRS